MQSFFLQLCCPPGELRCHFVGSGAVCFRAVLGAGRPDRAENSCLRGRRVGPGQKKGRNGSGRKILGGVRYCSGVKMSKPRRKPGGMQSRLSQQRIGTLFVERTRIYPKGLLPMVNRAVYKFTPTASLSKSVFDRLSPSLAYAYRAGGVRKEAAVEGNRAGNPSGIIRVVIL